jgi:hypothetical protein
MRKKPKYWEMSILKYPERKLVNRETPGMEDSSNVTSGETGGVMSGMAETFTAGRKSMALG